MNFESLAYNYTRYSDAEIEKLELLDKIKNASQVKSAINNVKKYFSNTLGVISLSSRDFLGSDEVFEEYVNYFSYGFLAWSDVLGECEEFVNSIQ